MNRSLLLSPRVLLVVAFFSAAVAVIAAIWAYPNQSQAVFERTGIGDATARLASDVSDLGTAAAPLLSRLGVSGEPAADTALPEPEPMPPPTAAPRPAPRAPAAAPVRAPDADRPASAVGQAGGFVPGYVPSAEELAPLSAAPAPAPAPSADADAGPVLRRGKVPAWLYDERVYSSQDTGIVPPRPLQPLLPREAPRGVDPSRLGVVEFVVDQAGDVEVVDLVRDSGSVNESMLLAVIKAWRFEPAMKDGLPVKFRQTVLLTY